MAIKFECFNSDVVCRWACSIIRSSGSGNCARTTRPSRPSENWPRATPCSWPTTPSSPCCPSTSARSSSPERSALLLLPPSSFLTSFFIRLCANDRLLTISCFAVAVVVVQDPDPRQPQEEHRQRSRARSRLHLHLLHRLDLVAFPDTHRDTHDTHHYAPSRRCCALS